MRTVQSIAKKLLSQGDVRGQLMDAIAMQRSQLFLWVPVFFALGIGIYFSLRTEVPIAFGIIISLFFAMVCTLFRSGREDSPTRLFYWLVSICLVLTSCGFLSAQIRTEHVRNVVLEKKIGPVEVIGTLTSIENVGQEQGSRIILSDLSIERLSAEATPYSVRLRLRKDKEVLSGDRIKVLALLNPPSPPVAPGAFDFQRYLYFQKIGAVGFVYNEPEILKRGSRDGLSIRIDALRMKIAEKIKGQLEYPANSIAIALITGQRKMISEDNLAALRGAGLAHMLAISGLHVGLVAGVVFFFSRLVMVLFQRLTLRHPVKKYAAVIAFVGAFSYMVLVGAPVTTQRAMIMTGIILIAVMVDRTAISLRLVALAAMIVLVFAPESLLSAGFHMSFGAVTALIAAYEKLKPWLSAQYRSTGRLRKIALYFLGVCITSLIASSATAPFALYHFQRFALFGLAGNLVAVPIMAFIIMPMAVFTLLLIPFGAEFIPLYVMEYGINSLLEISHWVSSLDGAVLHIHTWPLSALLCFVMAGLFLTLMVGRLRGVCIPFVLLGFVFIFLYNQADILISSSGKLTSFKLENKSLYVSSRKNDRFALENWERFAGLEEGDAHNWPREGSKPKEMVCGESGCHLIIKGVNIAFSKQQYGLKKDCKWADVLIANYPIKDWECDTPYIIDKFDTWRAGAHGVWIGKNGNITVKNANQLRGNRPWVSNKGDRSSKKPRDKRQNSYSSGQYPSDRSALN